MTRDEWLKAIPDNLKTLPEWLAAGIRLWDDMQAMGNAIKEASYAALYEDLPRAEQLGRGLIMLGEQLEEQKLIALGEMALGDALRLQMRYHEGSTLLDQAAQRFQREGDELGWARTRIGWLGTVHHLSDAPPLEPTVNRAVDIFTRHETWSWLSSLCINYAYYCSMVGQLSEWLRWCLRARQAAEQIKDEAERLVPLINSLNILISVYNDLGEYEAAEQTIEETVALFQGHEQIVYRYVEFLVKAGRFYLHTGRYTQALFYFYEARRRATSVWGQYLADIMIATAYLRLNRLDESDSLLRSVLQDIAGKPDLAALENATRVRLAHVYSGQNRWQEGLEILQPAIASMEAQQNPSLPWLSKAYQHQALLRYYLGYRDGREVVGKAIELAEKAGEPIEVVESYMVAAEVAENSEEAELALARAHDLTGEIPWLRWRIYQLTARWTNDPVRQRAALVQAANDLDRVQSSLAASFHADYLAHAQALYDELISVYLDQDEVPLAWQTLERAKSRALINTMMYHQEAATLANSPLVAELKRLQLRHYGLVKARIEGRVSRSEVLSVEIQIAQAQEALEVEQLGRREPLTVPPLYLPEAPPDSDLVGFYLVREEVHGFVHNGRSYHHVRLPTSASKLNELMRVLFVNMRTTPAAPASWIKPLTTQLHKILAQFDKSLLAPLRPFLHHQKLVVVPHGLLHQLPFHLLRHQGRYLLEGHEVRVIPTARPRLRSVPYAMQKGMPDHVVVSHSWQGRLPHTKAEGEMVAATLAHTMLYLDGAAATKEALLKIMGTRGVLHIAAHGEHRPDRPELSHIQLEDGQLSMVDLFQHSLQNSLVTLSACDTGQTVIRAGDDPVGLWRGFLAAGARSLLVSLWQLEDKCALHLMRNFYQKLMAGIPKVAALRSVQYEWLQNAEGRLRHPFYWGALQLIGDDGQII